MSFLSLSISLSLSVSPSVWLSPSALVHNREILTALDHVPLPVGVTINRRLPGFKAGSKEVQFCMLMAQKSSSSSACRSRGGLKWLATFQN